MALVSDALAECPRFRYFGASRYLALPRQRTPIWFLAIAGTIGLVGIDGVAIVDSDLNEAVSALKQSFQSRGIRATFGRADPEQVQALRCKLKLPRRYREFLLETEPLDVEIRTPTERVRLLPSSQLLQEQFGFALSDEGKPRNQASSAGWRPSWVVVAHSTLLGDPYFLDTALPDAEGDCPVFTAMSGTEQWKPRLCASSFALFIRILALGMELAEGFADDDLDIDDESVFREALGPKIREYDPAAVKAGHWT